MNVNLRSFVSAWVRCIVEEQAVLLIALGQFVLHMWVAAHDGIFRDELYYIAASRHLDFGFVEYPPLVAVAAGAERLLFGNSLVGFRLLPALAGALIVLLTADMVGMLGGGKAARVLAALTASLGPMVMGSSGLLTMDPFDIMWWTLCAWTLVRMIRDQQPRLWLLFGLFAGLGLENKLTMGFYAGALVLGLLLSSQRKLLFNRWLIFGGLIALALIAPYIIWNVQHGFATVQYTRMYSGGTKTYQATPLEFFFYQVMQLNPLTLPLWLGGLYFLFFTQAGKPYRAFGWAYLFLYVFFMMQHAKFYWLSGAYPVILASAAYGLEVLIRQRANLKWLQPAASWTVAISGLLIVPFAIPILPAETFIAYNNLFGGIGGAVKQENNATAELPQNYADRYGWLEMTQAVKSAYDTLTPQEQIDACIYTNGYGEAAAVDYFGPALGLPEAVSGSNSYFVWGPQGCNGKVLVTVNVRPVDLAPVFETVELAGHTKCTYCMPFENGAPIVIARGLKGALKDVWPTVQAFQ